MEPDSDTEQKTERFIFPLPKALAEKIDDYRFAHRVGSRSEAIRRLISAGLDVETKQSHPKS